MSKNTHVNSEGSRSGATLGKVGFTYMQPDGRLHEALEDALARDQVSPLLHVCILVTISIIKNEEDQKPEVSLSFSPNSGRRHST